MDVSKAIENTANFFLGHFSPSQEEIHSYVVGQFGGRKEGTDMQGIVSFLYQFGQFGSYYVMVVVIERIDDRIGIIRMNDDWI